MPPPLAHARSYDVFPTFIQSLEQSSTSAVLSALLFHLAHHAIRKSHPNGFIGVRAIDILSHRFVEYGITATGAVRYYNASITEPRRALVLLPIRFIDPGILAAVGGNDVPALVWIAQRNVNHFWGVTDIDRTSFQALLFARGQLVIH